MAAAPSTPLKLCARPPAVTPSPRGPALASCAEDAPWCGCGSAVVTPTAGAVARTDALRGLPDVALAQVLGALGAKEVAAVRECGRGVLDAGDVPAICAAIGGETQARVLRAVDKANAPRRCPGRPPRDAAKVALATLRVAELERVAEGVAAAKEWSGEARRGYWVSKSWAQQLRRYYEQQRAKLLAAAHHLDAPPSPRPRETAARRAARRRNRSGSGEALPPWPDCNAEIICEHGFLSPKVGAPRGKRLLVDRTTWRAIAHRFPLSTKLKASVAAECRACAQLLADRADFLVAQKATAETERLARNREVDECAVGVGQAHWWARPQRPPPPPPPPAAADDEAASLGAALVPALRPLTLSLDAAVERRAAAGGALLRNLLSKERARRGVPHWKVDARAAAANAADGARLVPLAVGRYHLVPRPWLAKWRRSLKVASEARPGPPTTADCLCYAHGRPVVPPHVADYLRGLAPDLLPRGDEAQSTTSARARATCEIVTGDEWAAINALFPVDFAVAFDVVPSKRDRLRTDVQWTSEPCRSCDDSNRGGDVDVTFRARDYKRTGRCRPLGEW